MEVDFEEVEPTIEVDKLVIEPLNASILKALSVLGEQVIRPYPAISCQNIDHDTIIGVYLL